MIDALTIAQDLDWAEPRQLPHGRIASRCDDLPNEFWPVWRDHKDELKAIGVRVGRDDDDGHFFAIWVRDVGDDQIPEPPADQLIKVTRFLKCPEPLAITMPYLHPDQRDAVWTLWRALDLGITFTLDASEAGIGKTWVALEVVKRLNQAKGGELGFGVVCPANIVTKWTDTAINEPFNLQPEFVLSYDKLRGGRHGFTERIRKRNKIHFDWGATKPVILIFDEVHYCAGPDSLNSRLLRAAIEDPLITCLTLSATVADSPLDLKMEGYGLKLHDLRDWWRWCLRTGCRPGPFGGLTFSTGDGRREPTVNQRRARRELAKVHASIFPKCGVRIITSDSELWRPKNQVFAELVDVDPHHPKIRHALDVLAHKELADEERAEAKEMGVSGLTINTRDRQRAELMKVPIITERIKELVKAGNYLIAFLNYRASIDLLVQLTGVSYLIIDGRTSSVERHLMVKSFQRNEVQLAIVQFDAGAQSIDLDDTVGNAPRCSLISPSYSAKRLYQALGRAYRPATTKSMVRQWILFAAGTIEERVGRLVQAKFNAQALINDGDLSGVLEVTPKK